MKLMAYSIAYFFETIGGFCYRLGCMFPDSDNKSSLWFRVSFPFFDMYQKFMFWSYKINEKYHLGLWKNVDV